MKIFVCIKQVPDAEAKIKFTSDLGGIDPTGIKWVINPYDEYAVEESIKIRDANPGSQVFVITLGPKTRAGEALRTALAMGADEGILIDAQDTTDAYSTAKALAAAIKAEGGADLLLTGKLSVDDNGSSVGQMLAEQLNVPHAMVVSKITQTPEHFVAERDVDGGSKEIIQIKTPAVLGANKGLNTPRFASLPGIMKAKKKVLKEYEISALGITVTDQKIKYSNLTFPADKAPVKLLAGDSKTQVHELAKLLRDEAKVL